MRFFNQQQTMKTINLNRRKFLKLILIVLGALGLNKLLGPKLLSAATWTEPTAIPPTANVPAPLNVGPNWQVKQGGLELNAASAQVHGLIVRHGITQADRLHTPVRLRIPVGINMFD